MWVATADLPQGGGHPFYERLNEILGAARFDAFVEQLCAPFYARMGRLSLAPGRYFRLLLVGYFEGPHHGAKPIRRRGSTRRHSSKCLKTREEQTGSARSHAVGSTNRRVGPDFRFV